MIPPRVRCYLLLAIHFYTEWESHEVPFQPKRNKSETKLRSYWIDKPAMALVCDCGHFFDWGSFQKEPLQADRLLRGVKSLTCAIAKLSHSNSRRALRGSRLVTCVFSKESTCSFKRPLSGVRSVTWVFSAISFRGERSATWVPWIRQVPSDVSDPWFLRSWVEFLLKMTLLTPFILA